MGFQKEGFHIATGMDINDPAVQNASYNLHWRFVEKSPYECRDITVTDAEEFKAAIDKNGCIVIGGPPCQAYSLAGRAKLKSLGSHRENTRDRRGYLFEDFLRLALDLDARGVVMENVPEAANYGGRNVPEIVCQTLEENGYLAIWTILNAADFGVPQKRERLILMAVKKELADQIELPEPTHHSSEPDLSNSAGRIRGFTRFPHFREPRSGDDSLPPWNTVKMALDDLPVLFTDPAQKYSLGRINQKLPYTCKAGNPYQVCMRNWYGTENGKVSANVFRKTLRDYPIFDRMKQGDNYVQASQIADQLLAEAAARAGITEESNPEEYEELKKKIVPPYDRENFLYKWTRLKENQPSHTLVAHLSVDTYSHIHPVEPRVFIRSNRGEFPFVKQQGFSRFRTPICFRAIWAIPTGRLETPSCRFFLWQSPKRSKRL